MNITELPPPSEAELPEGLAEAGRHLWESITNEFDFTGEPGKLAILERACRTADQITVLEAAIVGAELVVKGSTGQPVVNPMIAEVRQQSGLLNNLVKALGLPASAEEELAAAERRKTKSSNAAKARWSTSA